MYGAELVAEGRFCALYVAAGAVNHFRRDRYPVKLCPQGGGFLAQSVVVCNRCDAGVAGFAVQSTAADPLIFVFHSSLRLIVILLSPHNPQLPIEISPVLPFTSRPFPVHPVDRCLGLFQFFFLDDGVAVALDCQHFVYHIFDP